MIEFISATPNLPFSAAIAIMVVIAVMEGVGTVLGMGLSSLIDGLLPDIDLDIDADLPDADSSMALSRILGWLRFGQVPALILFVIFLTSFGLVGLSLQRAVLSTFGSYMPGILASIIAFSASLPVVRVLGGGLAKILPKDETSAVSKSTFVGRVATVTLGVARKGSPAEAKLHDQFGQSHYIMVEPDLSGDEFKQGDQVLLVKHLGSSFTCIQNTSDNLVD